MTQYFSGAETTKHERLLDMIVVRSAFETPLLSRLPHQTTDNIVVEWSLDEPFTASDGVRNIGNPHAYTRQEGDDFTFGEPNYPTRVKMICEIQHDGFEMSGTDRSANVAGMQGTWDYRMGQHFTKHLNSIDNTLMFGVGGPSTDGRTGSATERRTQGLIQSAAWTGQERMHGTSGKTVIQDVYGSEIPASMWSVFFDANHDAVTLDSFNQNVIIPLCKAGADMQTNNWMFECGYSLKARIARFLIAQGGIMLNDRNRSADDPMGSDYMDTFKLSGGQIVSFRVNRWLDDSSSTITINNAEYPEASPAIGSPDEEGTQSHTYYGDQFLIGHEPGAVSVQWYREPAFRDVATNGDYSRLAVVSEFGLKVDHPLSVAGMGNAAA